MVKTADEKRKAIVISELKKGKIQNLKKGGIVPLPKGYKKFPKNKGDIVPSVLEPGEIVVPVEHSKKVEKFLRKNKIILPGMKK